MEPEAATINNEVLRELVRAGIRGVSADNSQPWRFHLRSTGFDLLLAEQQSASFFDPVSAASLMSCGSVLENIRLAAGLFGLHADIVRHPEWQHDRRVASICFSHDSEAASPLAAHIHQRGTHRGYYRRWRHIPPFIHKRLAQSLSAFPGHKLYWFDRGQQRRAVQRLVTMADRLRFTHEQIHREFHECLRFGAQADITRDGLAWDTLGIERIFAPILSRLAPWPLTRRLNHIGLHYLMALRSAWLPLASAPAIGALVLKGEPDFISAGQALQRLWLTATEQGLAFQPFGALPLFLLRMRELNGAGFNNHQQLLLNTLRDEFWQLIAPTSEKQTLAMLFRVGYAPPLKEFARRWPVNHFLMGENQPPTSQ